MAGSPWRFYPPEREKGRVFCFFFNINDKEYPNVKPILAILLEKFHGKLLAVVPSPYNTLYEIAVYGITITLIEDNWPGPYLSASDSDAPVLERLLNDLKGELGATEIDMGNDGSTR
jgi:hypothetical protein